MQTEKVFIGDVEIDLDTQIEMAEHSLQCAISHLNELLAKREALHAHMDAQAEAYAEMEWGKVCIEADRHDKEIAEVLNNA